MSYFFQLKIYQLNESVLYVKALTKMFSYVCSYYIDRRVTKVEDFMKTRLLDTLSEQITKVLKVRLSFVFEYVDPRCADTG